MSNATEIFAAMAEAATNDGKKLRRKFKVRLFCGGDV